MQKSLIINGPLPDLSDVLQIARDQGKKLFRLDKSDKVTVLPFVYPYGTGYLVVVEKVVANASEVVGGGKATKE